jgi:hypothetical protein
MRLSWVTVRVLGFEALADGFSVGIGGVIVYWG